MVWLALVLFQFSRLSALAIDPSGMDLYHEKAPTHAFEFALFDFYTFSVNEHDSLVIKFWLAVSVISLWEGLGNMLFYSLVKKDFKYFNALPASSILVNFLAIALYIPVLETLLAWVDCRSNDESGDLTLHVQLY